MPILSEEDLERFRTKVCTLASSMRCDFGIERCNYSHNLYWARRCPFYLRDSSILRYIPACCPDVELGSGSSVLKNTCPRGNNCSFAHSLEEMHYHPLVYKTELCKDYRVGKCKTYYCHMVHGLAEFRVPRDFVLPRKRGLYIPPYAHVTIVDNIRGFQGGASSCGHAKDRSRPRQDRESPKAPHPQHPAHPAPTAQPLIPPPRELLQQSPPEPPSVRAERSLVAALSAESSKSAGGEKCARVRWGHDKHDLSSSVASSFAERKKDPLSPFPPLRADDVPTGSRSATSKAEGAEPCQKFDDYTSCLRLSARIDELSTNECEGRAPWYSRGSGVGELPAFDISSLDSIFQESLKGLGRQSTETGTGESMSKVTSLVPSEDAHAAAGANVVRDVSAWKALPPLPRSLSLPCGSDEEAASEHSSQSDVNTSLLEYIYHTVSQQCDMIAEKCVRTSNNRANLGAICREAHSLWQLVVSIQSLLYASGPCCGGPGASGCKSECDPFEPQWSGLGGFYSELLEAYESEGAGCSAGAAGSCGSSTSSTSGGVAGAPVECDDASQ